MKLNFINMARLLIPLLLFFIFSYTISIAQESNLSQPALQFQHLTEGLNNERITAIYQDHFGFMWIGTYNGLHRYDGTGFKVYLSNGEAGSLPNSRIEKIFSDSQGNLWIGTANSIARYNREYDNFSTYAIHSGLVDASNPAPNRISAIIEDGDGKIWVSSEKEGLFYFDEDLQEFVPYFNRKTGLQLSDIRITALAFDQEQEGVLWIGLKEGLNKLDVKSRLVTHFPFRPEQPHNIAGIEVRGLGMDKNGNLWIGSSAKGLFLLKKENQGKQLFDHYDHRSENNNSLGNNSIYSLLVDRQNQLWVGNENGGLHLYNRQEDNFYRYTPDPKDPFSISNNSIWSIFEDKEGRLWIGTGLKGLNIVDHNFSKFTHHYSSALNPHGLNNNLVREFREDREGNVWIATDGGGLNYWNRSTNRVTHFTHDPKDPSSIGSNALLDITEDADGRLWVATWAGGINVLTDRQKMHFRKLQDLQPNDSLAGAIVSSFALVTDREGNVWSGNFQKGLGLHNPENKSTQLFENDAKDKTSLSAQTLYTVLEDSEGNIWAGGETNGLNKMIRNADGKIAFKRYGHDAADSSSLAGDVVNQVFEDSQQNIWVANSGGLSRYLKETDNFVNFSSRHGLPSDFVVSVIEDGNGFLWIGSEKGLSRFDPEEKTFRNYSKSDGLQGDKFSRHAVIALSSGELMFGGTNGFNIFHPDEVQDNPYKPEVLITDFKLFNKPVAVGENDSLLKVDVSLTEEITLHYEQNVIGFEFVALNYTHSDRNSYAYMLEGLEEEWNYVGNTRMAAYTNLDPGEYTFRVKAANNDGVWNEEGTKLKIKVLPPWYRTWWFYILVCVVLGAGFFVFVRWREKRLQEDKALLAQAIDAKTKELEKKEAELIARDEADKIRNWTAQGLNQFTGIVNKNKEDIGILAQSILSHLIKFLHAGHGAVSILNDDDEEDQFLEVVATFAHAEGRKANRRFELDQGLIGACYSGGEVMQIDELPEGYSKFVSGLGEARMNHLILVPLRLDEFVVGVIELCSFHAFKEHEVEFLQKLGEIITSSLYTLKVSRRTSLLLEQARTQAEELQAQEEEIRQNMEELEATQENFFRKEQELLDKLKIKEEENEKLIKKLENKEA